MEQLKPEAIVEIIETGLQRLTHKRRVEVAYYGGSFTALPLTLQERLLQPAFEYWKAGKVQGIRLSTRPDCLSAENILLLQNYAVDTVELGVQSFDPAVLYQSKRGHTVADALYAVNSLQTAGVRTIVQLMIGLPGESAQSLLLAAEQLAMLRPQGIRIYPTVVLAQTPLATLYRQGLYQPLTLAAAIEKAAFLKWQAEQSDIKVIRVGLQATEELNTASTVIAGPYHPAFGEMVSSRLFYYLVAQLVKRANLYNFDVRIYHNPLDHSQVRGLANANLREWQEQFGLSIKCHNLPELARKTLLVYCDKAEFLLTPADLKAWL